MITPFFDQNTSMSLHEIRRRIIYNVVRFFFGTVLLFMIVIAPKEGWRLC